jgi:hypothetical protein
MLVWIVKSRGAPRSRRRGRGRPAIRAAELKVGPRFRIATLEGQDAILIGLSARWRPSPAVVVLVTAVGRQAPSSRARAAGSTHASNWIAPIHGPDVIPQPALPAGPGRSS